MLKVLLVESWTSTRGVMLVRVRGCTMASLLKLHVVPTEEMLVTAEELRIPILVHPPRVADLVEVVRVWPKDSAADVLKAVKRVTSHELREKHPHLRKLPSLWTRSYFASTAGNVSPETIRRYIEAQKGM